MKVSFFRLAVSALLALGLLAAPAFAGSKDAQTAPPPKKPDPATGYDPKADPAADLKQAVAEATRTHRRILLDVGGNWCIWCHYLDIFFDDHPDLKTMRDQNFVMLKINMSRDNENKEFLSKYPSIPGYPHLFVLDSNGRFLHSEGTSGLELGRSYNPDSVHQFLDQWKPRHLDQSAEQ